MKVYDTIQLKYVDGIINNEKNRKKISKLLLYNLDNVSDPPPFKVPTNTFIFDTSVRFIIYFCSLTEQINIIFMIPY